MATTYYLTTTASDLGTGESFSNALSESAPGTTTLTSTIANGDGMAGTIDSSDFAFTPSGDPGAGGTTGNYQLRVEISTGDTNVTLIPQLARVNSSGTVQTGPTGSDGGGQVASAGSKTFNWTSLSLGTWTSGDRLRLTFGWDNASTHGGAEVITQNIGSAGTDLDAPWSAPITANATALNAAPTYGTHAAQITLAATALVAAATLGTHYAITHPVANTPAPALWLDASNSATISATGNNLDSWTSAEGYGYAFDDCASGAGGNPQTGTATINGLNVIDFSTGVRYAECLGPEICKGAKGYVFIVFQENAGSTSQNFVLGVSEDGSGTTKFGFGVATNDPAPWGGPPLTVTRWNAGGTDTNFGGSKGSVLAAGTPTLSVSRSTGSAYETRRNGFSLDPVSVTLGTDDGDWFSLATATDVTVVGCLRYGGTSYAAINGYVAEILVYDDVDLSAGDLAAIEDYLIAKWAIPLAPVPDALNAGATLGTHTAETSTTVNATALAAAATLGTHAAEIQADATALVASPTLGTHSVQTDTTANATALVASPTLGTHSAQLDAGATALNAGPTLGTHEAGVSVTATALVASPTYGTHAAQFESAATALNAGATLGTHAAQIEAAATTLVAAATLGTHSVDLTYNASATALNAGATFGTHAAEIQATATALNAGPTLGTHSTDTATTVNATALDASPAYGTHAADLSSTATALDASATLGTHSVSVSVALSATALQVGTLGTHAAQLESAATALDSSATLGTHTAALASTATALQVGTLGTHTTALASTATALDSSATLGTHSVALEAAATALDASPTYGTHSVALTLTASATALDASPTLGTHATDADLEVSATALDASPTLGAHVYSFIYPGSLSTYSFLGSVSSYAGETGSLSTYSFLGSLD